MPYSSNDELPQSVRDKYSDKCQRAFRHAFNSTHEDTGDEGKAMASGHAAAQRCEEANKSMDMIDTAIETVGGTKFNIFTGLLKASRASDGKMRLHGVASSTTKDLHGDTMLASAIDDMEQAANNNLTIFLNHSYNVPEDVGGSVERAKSQVRGVDQDGNPNIDLNFDILVNDANARAVKTFEAIERGTKLGLSIGAMIPDGGAKRNKDGSYLIEHVDLLETSIVGIPANPRSWVEYAVKALKGKSKTETIPLGEPTLTLDAEENSYTITGSLENINLTTGTTTNNWQTSDNILWSPNVTIESPIQISVTDAATCPECGKPKGQGGDCGNAFHKDVEPEVTDAQVTIIQIDTGDGESGSDSDAPSSQEAPASGPETEGDGLLDETADGDDAALGDDVTRSVEPSHMQALNEALSTIRELTRDLVEARTELGKANVARAAAESARESAEAERARVLYETKALLDKVANSPLVRRTVVREAQSTFESKFAGIYDDDLLKMLEKRNADA